MNLVTQSLGYLLNIEPDSVDVHRFRRFFAEADNHDGPDRVAAVWDEALALWRGELLTGITGSWVDKMRQSLWEYLITAVVKHNETQLRAGQYAGMVGPLRGLVAEYPLDERLVGQLIRALYGSGQRPSMSTRLSASDWTTTTAADPERICATAPGDPPRRPGLGPGPAVTPGSAADPAGLPQDVPASWAGTPS